MQYLKETVRNRILQEALREFDRKGYGGASIRTIAKNAGTSAGNFYKYFASKEALYEQLIGSVYNRLMRSIEPFEQMEYGGDNGNIIHELMEKILELIEANRVELSILLHKSQGSRYESCKRTFVDAVTGMVTKKLICDLSRKNRRLADNFLPYLLSCNLVESISVILKNQEKGPEVRSLILNLIDILFGNLADQIRCGVL